MADSAEQVAVESAAQAATSAMIADNAASAATSAAADIVTAQTEATVEVAQAAVVLAETQAAIVTAEAAAVISDAASAIAQNEESNKWQEERIKSLETTQSEVLKQLGNLTLAVTELATPLVVSDLPQSTPPNSTVAIVETPPPTVEPTIVAENQPSADADDQKAAEQVRAAAEAKRKRVLRFL